MYLYWCCGGADSVCHSECGIRKRARTHTYVKAVRPNTQGLPYGRRRRNCLAGVRSRIVALTGERPRGKGSNQ